MDWKVGTWLGMRALRWLFCFGFVGYCVAYLYDRPRYINIFGQLLPSFEFAVFGFGIGAVFLGFLELMMREKAGLVRPGIGQLIPPREASQR
jgi:hypothetical protein